MMTSRASSPSCETSCETSVGRDEVLGRGRTSVVTRARASGRMVAVAVKRVRVDDDAVAAQVRMEMRVLSRAMRRDRARVGGCLLYTSPSPRDLSTSRMPSSA